jgi:hypothetical protein
MNPAVRERRKSVLSRSTLNYYKGRRKLRINCRGRRRPKKSGMHMKSSVRKKPWRSYATQGENNSWDGRMVWDRSRTKSVMQMIVK